jgi:U1 small nuclear ribonucleoprotein
LHLHLYHTIILFICTNSCTLTLIYIYALYLNRDPFKTLFVGRLSYDTTEKRLRREFEQYGKVKSVKMVTDRQGKPRGYAFVDFESEHDVTAAYKKADGLKLDDRRIVVDVERGR